MAKPNRVDDDLLNQWIEPTGYKRSTVYNRSTDQYGNYDQRNVKFPPDVMARTEELLASKSNPSYRTTHDVIRNGLVHVLHFEAERANDPDTIAWVNHLAHVAKMDRRAAQNLEWKGTIEQVGETLATMKADKDPASIRDTIDDVTPSLDIMPEPYRTRLAEVLDGYRTEPRTY